MLGKPAEQCNLILCHLGELLLTFQGWIDLPSHEKCFGGRCLWMDLAANLL